MWFYYLLKNLLINNRNISATKPPGHEAYTKVCDIENYDTNNLNI